MLRRIGVIASLAAVAVMFAGVSPAQAAVGDAAVCVFTGLQGTLVDNANADGIPSAHKDLSDLDPVDIERGTYQFGGPATCAGVFNRRGIALAPNNVTITSSGNYQSMLCGTGWAQDIGGDGTIIEGPGIADVRVGNFGYEMLFLAETGPLFIGSPLVSTAPDTQGTPLGGTYTGLGVVRIQPVFLDNCVTTDTSRFFLAGAFVATGTS